MNFFKTVIRVRESQKRGEFVQVVNSKVVFRMHLQLINDNIIWLNCYKIGENNFFFFVICVVCAV